MKLSFLAALLALTFHSLAISQEPAPKSKPEPAPTTSGMLIDVLVDRKSDFKLVEPFGISFLSKDDYIIVELSGGRVIAVLPDSLGQIGGALKQKGDAGDGEPFQKSRFNGLHNVAMRRTRQIFVADTWNHKIRLLTINTGKTSTFAGTGKSGYSGDGGPATKATFGGIYCVSLNPKQDKLYLADLDNRRIRVIDIATGIVSLVAGNGEKGVPKDGSDAKTSPLVDPRAVAVDHKGNIYILERGGHALRVVDSAGKIRTVVNISGKAGAAGDGGDAKSATLNGPKHLCIDREDNVIIADAENHLIRKYIPSTGQIVRVAGTGKRGSAGIGGPPDRAELARPHGVAISPDGKLYIVDTDNHRILRIDK